MFLSSTSQSHPPLLLFLCRVSSFSPYLSRPTANGEINLPAFSKFSGILLFVVLQFLLLGSLWTFFGKGEASGLIGNAISSNEKVPFHQKIAFFILVESIFAGLSILSILALTNICCPNRHLFFKGIQRIKKFSLPSIPKLADESSGLWFVAVLSGHRYCCFRLLNICGTRFQQLGNPFHMVIFGHYSFLRNVSYGHLSSGSEGNMVQSWFLGIRRAFVDHSIASLFSTCRRVAGRISLHNFQAYFHEPHRSHNNSNVYRIWLT